MEDKNSLNLKERKHGIIDGHVHLHYKPREEGLIEILKEDENSIYEEDPSKGIEKTKRALKNKYVEKVLGIFVEKDLEYIEPYLDDEFISPGFYVLIGDYDIKTLKEQREKFDFAKINNGVPFTPWDYGIEEAVEDCVVAGFDKIQIHTQEIKPGLLDLVEDYAGSEDVNFYFVHGIDALKVTEEAEVSSSDVKKLEGNLFLGSSTSGTITYGDIRGIGSEGLQDMTVFESDVTLHGILNNFSMFDANVRRADIGKFRKKIFHDNVERFLE